MLLWEEDYQMKMSNVASLSLPREQIDKIQHYQITEKGIDCVLLFDSLSLVT